MKTVEVEALGIEQDDKIKVAGIVYTVYDVAFDLYASFIYCKDQYGNLRRFTRTHDEYVELVIS